MCLIRGRCCQRESAFIRGWLLLLRGFLSSGVIRAVTDTDSFQSIWSDLVSNKAATLAANADGDVGTLFDTHALGVIAPNETIEVAGRLDGKLGLVFFAIGILARRVVVSLQT